MITKHNRFVQISALVAVLVFGVAATPMSVKADSIVYGGWDTPTTGTTYGGWDTPTSYNYGGWDTPVSYYEPKTVQWYEPTTISYNQPSTYTYSQPYVNNYRTDYSYNPGTYSVSSYDYSYDYVYDYTYEYDYDACSNMPGNQSHGYDCYPVVDYCSNIPGNQPHGYDCEPDYDYCSNIPGNQPRGYDCYPDRDRDEDVSCDLSVSDSTVEDGDRVTLEWETDGNLNYASINQGIGRVDEDGGDERVEIDGDTTFRMTVRNNDGDEDTCSVTVRVDDENNFSSVTFVGEPTNNPPVVYLSDVPYTGLEDVNPALLSYWLMLIAGAGALAWFLYTKGMIPTFAFASAVEPSGEDTVGDFVEEGEQTAPEVENFLLALATGQTERALDYVRSAAASGTGVEEFLASAESVATDSELQARVSAALAESRETGMIGVKAVLAA